MDSSPCSLKYPHKRKNNLSFVRSYWAGSKDMQITTQEEKGIMKIRGFIFLACVLCGCAATVPQQHKRSIQEVLVRADKTCGNQNWEIPSWVTGFNVLFLDEQKGKLRMVECPVLAGYEYNPWGPNLDANCDPTTTASTPKPNQILIWMLEKKRPAAYSTFPQACAAAQRLAQS